MPSVKSFPQQVLDYLATGLGLSVSGAELSPSNPMPVLSQLDSKTSNSQSALEGISAKCWINCPAVAAKFSGVQIWNPIGSVVNLLIIGLNAMNASGTRNTL